MINLFDERYPEDSAAQRDLQHALRDDMGDDALWTPGAPTPDEVVLHEARCAYFDAMDRVMQAMPPEVIAVSQAHIKIAIHGGDVREMKRLGIEVQRWRDMAEADAHAACVRGDHGIEAMNYAIMRAARDG